MVFFSFKAAVNKISSLRSFFCHYVVASEAISLIENVENLVDSARFLRRLIPRFSGHRHPLMRGTLGDTLKTGIFAPNLLAPRSFNEARPPTRFSL